MSCQKHKKVTLKKRLITQYIDFTIYKENGFSLNLTLKQFYADKKAVSNLVVAINV